MVREHRICGEGIKPECSVLFALSVLGHRTVVPCTHHFQSAHRELGKYRLWPFWFQSVHLVSIFFSKVLGPFADLFLDFIPACLHSDCFILKNGLWVLFFLNGNFSTHLSKIIIHLFLSWWHLHRSSAEISAV